MKKQVCPICGKEISLSNYNKHVKAHDSGVLTKEKQERQLRIKQGNLRCIYCNKLCKTGLHLAKHENYCRLNPNRLIIEHKENFNIKGRTAWNKGLTKETDDRVQKGANKRKLFYKTHDGKFKGKHHSTDVKNKLSTIAKDRNFGGHFYRGGEEINGVKLESSFEVITALSLNKNNIIWIKPKRFKYKDLKEKIHTYTPDFYLPEYNVYLDPKNDYLLTHINPSLGYKDVDKIKWVEEQNQIRVIILNKDNLTWDKIKTLI